MVEVTTSDGVEATYVGTLSEDGQLWSAAGVDLGAGDGLATATVVATDVIGNTSRVSRSWPLDGTAPELTLTLDGAPFPGAAPGETPPAGAVPVVFARQIAAGAPADVFVSASAEWMDDLAAKGLLEAGTEVYAACSACHRPRSLRGQSIWLVRSWSW